MRYLFYYILFDVLNHLTFRLTFLICPQNVRTSLFHPPTLDTTLPLE